MNKPNSPMAAESPFRSPASHLENLSPSYSPPHPDLPSPASIVSWSASAAAAESHPPLPSVDTKAALPSPPHQDGGSRSVASIVRRNRAAATLKKAAIVARVSSAILCLISFSVMAADKNKGWTLDSFDHYNEYRYCLSVNVIGFVYAGFQAFAGVHHMVHERHIIERPMGYYFDFAMDQILAYLLISASSSATSRTDYWVTNWGTDPFPNMISGSVAISFLAFMAFAVSSLISAYNLFSSRSNV